jgi:O-antigen ligase
MENSIRRINKMANLFFLIPIFMAMVSCKKNLVKAFLIGATIGGFALLGIAIYQAFVLGHPRVGGFYNVIMFGTISVVIALALFVSLLFTKVGKMQFLVISLSLLGALIATVLSGTRGAWLGLIIAVPFAVGLTFLVNDVPRKRIILVVVKSIVLVSIVGILVGDAILDRWQTTSQSIDVSKPLTDQRSSIGQRLMMWDAAVKIWYRNPIIGTGLGDFHVDFDRMKKSGEVMWAGMDPRASGYAHNTLFEALASTGILGLVGLILSTFILPLVYFFKALKVSVDEYDRYAAAFGMVFITAFLIFGLTENWLVHKQLVITFLLLLAIMASRFGSRAG